MSEAGMADIPVTTTTRIAETWEIAPGAGKAFQVGEREIAIFNADGNFFAIDNHCPHQKGPLAEGPLDGTRVLCPWHGWEFDLGTGILQHDPTIRVACYELKVIDEEILVVLPD